MNPATTIHIIAIAKIEYGLEPDEIKIAVGPSDPPIIPIFLFSCTRNHPFIKVILLCTQSIKEYHHTFSESIGDSIFELLTQTNGMIKNSHILFSEIIVKYLLIRLPSFQYISRFIKIIILFAHGKGSENDLFT